MKHSRHIGRIIAVCAVFVVLPLFVYYLSGNIKDKYAISESSIDRQIGVASSSAGQ
jgi:hypothetical protein